MGMKTVAVEYLVIAGGGGGGGGGGYAGGGGGAGGYREGTNHKISGTVTITVGGAGSAATGKGGDGGDSVMADITSTGETLKANNLRVLKDGTILSSSACLLFSKNKKGINKILNSFK